jgi:RNA polymerase sigma factor (TIGR02999 family)
MDSGADHGHGIVTIVSGVADITELLQLATEGDKGSESQLYDRVYRELRRIAGAVIRTSPSGRTQDGLLQPTALVNEAYLRLLGDHGVSWNCRAHFFNAAALAMRRILLDAARSQAGRNATGGCSASN